MPHFIPDLPVILTFALATLILAITPGPDMALFISRTINHGRAHGVASVFGAVSGLLIHTLLAAFGVTLLLLLAPAAFLVLKIAGALYLFWLAVQAIRTGGGLTLQKAGKTVPSLKQSYLTGLGINLTNPKIVLFFITFLPQFIDAADPDASAKLIFLGVEFLAISVPIILLVVLLADWAGQVLTRSRLARKLLNWSFAAVFASFAIAILATEARR